MSNHPAALKAVFIVYRYEGEKPGAGQSAQGHKLESVPGAALAPRALPHLPANSCASFNLPAWRNSALSSANTGGSEALNPPKQRGPRCQQGMSGEGKRKDGKAFRVRPGSAPAPPVLGRARALPRPPARALPRPPARTGRGTCGGGAGRARRGWTDRAPRPAAPLRQPPPRSPAAPRPLSGSPRPAAPLGRSPRPHLCPQVPAGSFAQRLPSPPRLFPGSRRQTGRTGFPGSPGGEQGRGRSRRRLPIGDCPGLVAAAGDVP